ncbi:MAG: hypothetical protein LJE62_00125 [Silicimonas sp.]|nr:hypothetical protein [Silicimonas sp.]
MPITVMECIDAPSRERLIVVYRGRVRFVDRRAGFNERGRRNGFLNYVR